MIRWWTSQGWHFLPSLQKLLRLQKLACDFFFFFFNNMKNKELPVTHTCKPALSGDRVEEYINCGQTKIFAGQDKLFTEVRACGRHLNMAALVPWVRQMGDWAKMRQRDVSGTRWEIVDDLKLKRSHCCKYAGFLICGVCWLGFFRECLCFLAWWRKQYFSGQFLMIHFS